MVSQADLIFYPSTLVLVPSRFYLHFAIDSVGELPNSYATLLCLALHNCNICLRHARGMLKKLTAFLKEINNIGYGYNAHAPETSLGDAPSRVFLLASHDRQHQHG